MIEKSFFDNFVESLDILKMESFKYLEWYNNNVKEVEGYQYLDFISIDEDRVTFEGDEYWNYGGHETHYFSFSTEALFDNGYRDNVLKKVQIEKETAEKEKIKKETEEKAKQEKQDRELYEKLKQKFEEDRCI